MGYSIKELAFYMQSPFSFNDFINLAKKYGYSDMKEICEVLSDLCSNSALVLRDGMFYRLSLRSIL